MNSVNIVANLTRDPELKDTKSETAVCSMRVAISGPGQTPDYVDVTTFGKLAEACSRHLSKGRQVAIGGRLSSSEWETQAGDKRSRVEVIANDVRFLAARAPVTGVQQPEAAAAAA